MYNLRMEIRIDHQNEVMSLFRTPLARFRLPNSEIINPGLEEAILKRQAEDTGVEHSNVRGWHSARDLHTWPEPEVKELVDSMRSSVLNMVSLIAHVKNFTATVELAAWGNVNGPGSYNQYHSHPDCLWSGVYYVRAGNYDDDGMQRPGHLKLYDPRGAIDQLSHPGLGWGKNVNIPPEDGMMVLFPSWLHHSVNSFDSDTTRISIAFNARVHEFKEVSDPAQASR